MKKLICLIVFMFLLFFQDLFAASHFLGLGYGYRVLNLSESDGNISNNYVPFIIEYEYGPKYRDLWLLYTSVDYLRSADEDSSNDLIVNSVGIKYVPKFFYYISNYTEKSREAFGCFSILLLPLTVMRDVLVNVAQLLVPKKPYISAGMTHVYEMREGNTFGLFFAPGVTNGLWDFKLKYIHNIYNGRGFSSDYYIFGFDFTFHFPLQDRFIRQAPLID